MTKVILTLTFLIAAAFIALGIWRWTDKNVERAVWKSLIPRQPSAPSTFDPSMIADLPDPARRFFRFAIRPGTPLYTVAEISMEGELSLGDKTEPNFVPMVAEQILAALHGFVWKVRAGDAVWFVGSDGAIDEQSWSRFWLFGIVPVARAGNNEDHARAAFGRYAAEAVFWTPAALLPRDNVRWEQIDDSTVRVIVTHRGLQQAVDVSVDFEGRPIKVLFQRWSNANAEKIFRFQPFGGYSSEYRDFSGFRLPTRVEAGNFFETEDYFAFFKATVTSVRFPTPSRD